MVPGGGEGGQGEKNSLFGGKADKTAILNRKNKNPSVRRSRNEAEGVTAKGRGAGGAKEGTTNPTSRTNEAEKQPRIPRTARILNRS
jgi:hypothetical protein